MDNSSSSPQDQEYPDQPYGQSWDMNVSGQPEMGLHPLTTTGEPHHRYFTSQPHLTRTAEADPLSYIEPMSSLQGTAVGNFGVDDAFGTNTMFMAQQPAPAHLMGYHNTQPGPYGMRMSMNMPPPYIQTPYSVHNTQQPQYITTFPTYRGPQAAVAQASRGLAQNSLHVQAASAPGTAPPSRGPLAILAPLTAVPALPADTQRTDAPAAVVVAPASAARSTRAHGPQVAQFSSYEVAATAYERLYRQGLELPLDDVDAVAQAPQSHVQSLMDALSHLGHMEPPTEWSTIMNKKKLRVTTTQVQRDDFSDWQERAEASLRQSHQQPNFDTEVAFRAWSIFREMIEVHRTGFRFTKQAKAKNLKCSDRIKAGVKIIKDYALIRKKLLEGDKIHDFCTNPKAYADTAVRHLRNNNTRRQAKGDTNDPNAKKPGGRGKTTVGGALWARHRPTGELAQHRKRLRAARAQEDNDENDDEEESQDSTPSSDPPAPKRKRLSYASEGSEAAHSEPSIEHQHMVAELPVHVSAPLYQPYQAQTYGGALANPMMLPPILGYPHGQFATPGMLGHIPAGLNVPIDLAAMQQGANMPVQYSTEQDEPPVDDPSDNSEGLEPH